MRDEKRSNYRANASSLATSNGGDGVMTRKRRREEQEQQKEQQRIKEAMLAAKGIGGSFDTPSNIINQIIATTQLPQDDTDLLFGFVWRDHEIRPQPRFFNQAIPKTVCLEQKQYTKFHLPALYEDTYDKILRHTNLAFDTEWDYEIRRLPYSIISPEEFAKLLVQQFETPRVQRSIHANGRFYAKNSISLPPPNSEGWERMNRQRLYFYSKDDDEVKGYSRAYYKPATPCEGSNVVEAFSIWLKKQPPRHREGSVAALVESFVPLTTPRFEDGQIVSAGNSNNLDHNNALPLRTVTGKIVTHKHVLPFDVNDRDSFSVESSGHTIPPIQDITE